MIEVVKGKLISKYGSWPEVDPNVLALYDQAEQQAAEVDRLRKAMTRPREEYNDLTAKYDLTFQSTNQTYRITEERAWLREEMAATKAEKIGAERDCQQAVNELRGLVDQVYKAAGIFPNEPVISGGGQW